MTDKKENEFVATDDDVQQLIDEHFDSPPVIIDETSLVPAQTAIAAIEEIKSNPIREHTDVDYNFARDNLRKIINTSIDALRDLEQVAQDSQQPRAYEVLSLLVKTISDANKELVALHRQHIELEIKSNEGGKTVSQQQNNIFVGSTAELDELLKMMHKR